MKKIILISFLSIFLTSFIETEDLFLTHSPFEADSNKLFCPPDMEIKLWAESPMFYNPTNIDVDAKGRVWVTEAVNYRDFNNKPETRLNRENGERVMILEDTDLDGKADKSTVFVEDNELISPLGIAVVGNKVYVSAAPNLIVYTDENGDDKADKKEVFLTGFGGKDHDHSLHSGVMAPDGQFFFNVGNAGPHVVIDKTGWTLRSGSVYTGGTPYNLKNEGNMVSDDGRVYVGGMAFKIGQDGKGLKVLGHNFRNSYEVAIDSYGNMWQNDNDDQVIACRTSFLMENGNAGYFSADGTRTWQADRRPNQDMFTASWHQEDPGVMPAGDNAGAGSPTGFHVYEGDAFGPKYRGMLLNAEAGRNVIFNFFPVKKGGGFELKRHDLVSSQGPVSSEKYDWYETDNNTRKWFRPSDVCAGTDGSIFIADWYDPIVGGHAMHDKKGYGRIYRLTPKGKKLSRPKIDISTVEGQIKALKNPAQNVRYLGFEALLKSGESSIPFLKKMLFAENPFHKARAIWLLAQLGEKGKMIVFDMLKSTDVNTRLVAFRALREQMEIVSLSSIMKDDPSAEVRREVAISLRDVPFEKSKIIITSLLQKYDGKDPWYLEALGTAADRKEDQVYTLAKTIFQNQPEKLLKLAWRLHPANAVEDLMVFAKKSDLEIFREKAITGIAFNKSDLAVKAMMELSKSNLVDVKSQAIWWLNFRKDNDWADLVKWETFESTIVSENMAAMLNLKKILLDGKASELDKINAAKKMATDADGGNMIVNLKASYQLSDKVAKEISEDILNNPDTKVRILASQFFPRNGQPLKIDFVSRMQGNKTKGKQIFTQNCLNCHRHTGKGADIGPDLTNIHKKFDKLSLLDGILNPSANIVFGYENYVIECTKDRFYMGFLLAENTNTITLKDAGGQRIVIKKAEIIKKEKMAKSLMPDPSSLGLKEQELADLSEYLMSFK